MNKLVYVVFVASLVAAGCSKKGSDCDAAIAKGIDAFSANMKQRTPSPSPEMIERMTSVMAKVKPTLIEHCKADGWSPEVVACYGAAGDRKQMAECQAKMTPDQVGKLTADLTKVMMAAGPGAAMGRMPSGHPEALQGNGSAAPGEPAAAPPAAGSTAPAAPPAGSPAAPPAGSPPAAAAAGSGSAAGGW
jgi:hypothetical protein